MKYLLFIALLFLHGCATKVSTLQTDSDLVLEADKGYLLIGVETNSSLKGIRLNGPSYIELTHNDLKRGSNFILVDLKAGNYIIEEILISNYASIEIDDGEFWTVDIRPGVINYVGNISVVSRGFWFRYSEIELVNKSSYALEFLEDKYPNVLSSRELHYGGQGEDDFLRIFGAKPVGGVQ